MTPPWSPYDFILNGEFAGPDILRDVLERIRLATRSTCCVLIVHQAGELFQSLMYVRHEDPDREPALQGELAAYPLNREDRDAIERLLEQGREETLSRLLGNLAWRLFAGIPKSSREEPCRLEVSPLRPRLKASGPNPARVGVLCIGVQEPAPAALLDELTVAVHASAPVYLHRVGKGQEKRGGPFQMLSGVIREHFGSNHALAATDPAGGAGHDLAPLDRFLREVLDSLGATQGAVYMMGDYPGQLVPVARLGPGKTDRYEPHIGSSIEVKKGGGVVSEVKRQRRPMLYNGQQNFEQMVPKIGLIPFSRVDPTIRSDAALAVPIIDKSKPDNPVIGVLIVEKQTLTPTQSHPAKNQDLQDEKWTRPFTLQDVAFLQEAADRLMTAWIGGWDNALNRIVQATKRQLRPYRVRPAEPGYPPSATPPVPNLPSDFARVPDLLRDMLVPFCKTVSVIAACTVRVLSVDQRQLILLMKHPSDLPDVPPHVDLHGDSPIAQVVVSGKKRSGPSSELPTPVADLESYTSLPLVIDSRCIGAVTFASAYPSTFLLHLSEALDAATETVAAAIENAQTQALASILGSTIQLFRTLHEIEKIPGRSGGYLEEAMLGIGGRVTGVGQTSEAIEKVRGDLKLLRDSLTRYVEARHPRAAAVIAPNETYSVRTLVEELLRVEDASRRFVVHTEPWPGDDGLTTAEDRLDPRVYEVCLDAMSDLIRNARFEMSVAVSRSGEIYLHRRELGGRRYACVTLCNQMRLELPESLLAGLYREPLLKPKDDRLHYGAFLAAWLVRSVGGDVHLACRPDERFSVTVEIPLLPPDVK